MTEDRDDEEKMDDAMERAFEIMEACLIRTYEGLGRPLHPSEVQVCVDTVNRYLRGWHGH